MPTWNSARWLDRVLSSLRGDTSFPLGRTFIIDRASTDGTQELAARHGAEVLTDTVSLGSARERGFRAARTPWVLVLDSDVELYDGWFADVARHADLPDTGALQPTPVPPWMRRGDILEAYRRRVFPQDRPVALAQGGRGYTYCTLIRRDLVVDLPLSRYDAYEDQAISEAVQARMATWWIVPVFPTHHINLGEVARKARWNAAGRRNAGRFRARREAAATVGSLKDGIVDAVRWREPRFAAHAGLVALNNWVGYLAPTKYRRRHGGSR